MTKEQLKQYSELDSLFNEECKRVANILSNFEVYQQEYSSIEFADRFYDGGTDVHWTGDEYWSMGGHEEHSGYFPSEYLTMTDDEVRTLAGEENDEYLKKIQKKKEEEEEKERQRELELYKRLKDKYED